MEGALISKKKRSLEFEQALLRLAVVVVAVICGDLITSYDEPQDSHIKPIVIFGFAYIVMSAFSVIHVYVVPEGKRWRHTVYMFMDIFVTTIVIHSLGEHGVLYFVLYLWITVGNGFRYGAKELMLCATISMIGFMYVVLTTDYWREELLVTATAIMLLSVIPVYVAVMLKRLHEAMNLAEQASKEKSRFIANVSHELRTPLNAVVGFSEVIDKVDRDEQRRIASLMRESSSSLMSLIDNVLDFSRIEAGVVELKSESLDPRGLLNSIGGMFSMQAQQKGIVYSTVVDDSVPEHVAGDPQRMRQVLVNIIGNAVKFTSQGRIGVWLGVREMNDGAQVLHFEVSDTGPGICPDMCERIFNRFTQVDNSARRRYQGAGLGTSIARSLVELMGGRIGVESESGKGSCFWFHVPLSLSAECNLRSAERTREFMAAKLPDSGFSVLVAEDCEINRYVYRKMFDQLGVKADFAENGAQVFGLLARNQYKMLIVDMQMPGMSGLDIVNRYNAETESYLRIPVVMITGDATVELEEACREAGVSEFITKPVEMGTLRNLVGGCYGVRPDHRLSVTA